MQNIINRLINGNLLEVIITAEKTRKLEEVEDKEVNKKQFRKEFLLIKKLSTTFSKSIFNC